MERLFCVPNTDGPRVRVGLLWFAVLAPATYFGAVPTAALFAVVGGIAALQSAQAWRRIGYRPSRIVAGPAAVALPVAAISSYTLPALGIIVLPVVALVAALVVPRARRRTSAIAAAGLTVRCVLPAALAGIGMVLSARIGVGAAMAFVVLVSAYDVGSFIFGAESHSPAHGIIAGSACTVFAVAPIFAFQLPPFDGEIAAVIFAGLVAVCAPLGQIAAAASLPSAATWVPALRRLDAYVVTAPVWVWAMWRYLG